LPGEGERHKRIRKTVEKDVRTYLQATGRKDSHRVIAAHEKGAGTISLFRGYPSRKSKMSDADLIVVNDDDEVVCIIEVKDKDVRPKDLIGIIGATSMCNIASHKDTGEMPLRKAALYIVVNSEGLGNQQSMKRQQLEIINKEFAKGRDSVNKAVICSESEFPRYFRV
jgi:hypothetical protein